MKKIFMAASVIFGLMSCGNESNEAESSSDSTMLQDANQSPMGDTANQINSNTGNYSADTGGRSGDDSVKGTNPRSRTTTPGNQAGQSQ